MSIQRHEHNGSSMVRHERAQHDKFVRPPRLCMKPIWFWSTSKRLRTGIAAATAVGTGFFYFLSFLPDKSSVESALQVSNRKGRVPCPPTCKKPASYFYTPSASCRRSNGTATSAKPAAGTPSWSSSWGSFSRFTAKPAVSWIGQPLPWGPQGPSRPAPGKEVAEMALRERPGTVIGPYKLLQQIGEGGMGTVFMAEQTQPVRRKVALKVIKPGMDSRQVIARFEAERQALAMMDHVNIARVLDAGATESGRPYFVMELVHGVPITKYCDDNHLTPRERLELFVPVCQAIQHAHQKGIIHRDIKPSNVMITLYDGKPVPKVIDFGVAKATEQKLTERTLFTQYGTMVGTLEYMSPEQAEMSALGVDTRSDIYSLGVLLYELLTGSTPLTHKRVQEAAYGEILRMIKEEEPPRPSTRLSDSGEALASISAQRHMEPAKLTKLVRGELDWIVMKTLEKDRNRRYETANGFAADVQRYLNDEPVQACPPSARYRFRKFARRNKEALAAAVLVSASLVAAVVVLLIANYQMTKRRNVAEREHQRAEANLIKAREAVDDYLTKVSESTLLSSSLPGLQPLRRELLQTALPLLPEFCPGEPRRPKLAFRDGGGHISSGSDHSRDRLAGERSTLPGRRPRHVPGHGLDSAGTSETPKRAGPMRDSHRVRAGRRRQDPGRDGIIQPGHRYSGRNLGRPPWRRPAAIRLGLR